MYFAQGLPCIFITMLGTIFYKSMGQSNLHAVLIGSLLTLPWVIKPVFTPLIESLASKRQWTVVMQFLLAICFILTACSVNQHNIIPATCLLAILAVLSANHDIASDGVYIVSLSQKQQYSFIGLRNCSYQMARLFCQGAILFLIGVVAKHYGNIVGWRVAFIMLGLLMLAMSYIHAINLPEAIKPDEKVPKHTNVLKISKNIMQDWLQKPEIILSLSFVLFYNFAQAQQQRILPLFLIDSAKHHGLHMSITQLGITQFYGVCALIVGAFAMSLIQSKISLRRCINIGTSVLMLSNIGYLFLAYNTYSSIYTINTIYVIAELIFGFCNAAYMIMLLQQAKTCKFSTSYYALTTAIMTAGIMCFGILSGYVERALHYKMFFIYIIGASAVVTLFCFYFSSRYKLQ